MVFRIRTSTGFIKEFNEEGCYTPEATYADATHFSTLEAAQKSKELREQRAPGYSLSQVIVREPFYEVVIREDNKLVATITLYTQDLLFFIKVTPADLPKELIPALRYDTFEEAKANFNTLLLR